MTEHRQVEWAALFYKLSLEKHIPVGHLLRSLTRLHVLGEINRTWRFSTTVSAGLRSISN